MHFKKFVALLLSAALALTVFAGCGSESLLQLLLDLLQAQYQNITITAEDDLEATLRQAVRENDSMEEIDNALQDALLPTIQFQSLRSARAGDQAFDLVFRTGTDTEAMARQTYTDWNTVLGSLPSNGQYLADLATLKAENGYYILVNITVKKGSGSGSGSDSSSDPDDPSTPTGDRGYKKVNKDTYTVYRDDGLKNLFEDNPKATFKDKIIVLESDCTVDKALVGVTSADAAFNGTLKSKNSDKPATIKLSGGYMFTIIDGNGMVQDLKIEVTDTISGKGNIGVVAGENHGTVKNCRIKLNGTVEGTNAGGVVGSNVGTIEGCSVEGGTIQNSRSAVGPSLGGIAGKNSNGNSNGNSSANKGVIKGCYATSTVTGNKGGTFAGGVVGLNILGSVKGCYHTGAVSASGDGSLIGGVVGKNGQENDTPTGIVGTIYACYWNGTPAVGVGNWKEGQNESYKSVYGDTAKNMVDDPDEWPTAVAAMERESGYTFGGTYTKPTFK